MSSLRLLTIAQSDELVPVSNQVVAERPHPHHIGQKRVHGMRLHATLSIHPYGGEWFPRCSCMGDTGGVGSGCATQAEAWIAPCPVEAEERAAWERATAIGAGC